MTDLTNLPLTSSHWGMYRVATEAGVVNSLHSFEHDPDPSPIGPGIVDVLDGPTRVSGPMVRKSWLEGGPGTNNHLRGKEAFVAVTWDHVNRLVADEVRRVRQTHGNNAIFGGSYGWSSAGRFHHAQGQLHRFLNCLGGYVRSLNTYSFAAGEVIVPHVLGTFRPFVYGGPTWTDVITNTELLVAFGGVRVNNGQINQGGVAKHRQRLDAKAAAAAGVRFVNISPIRSDVMTEIDAEWIAPKPSTDAALMLGAAHTLLVHDLHDSEFLEAHTVGFERFSAYLLGESDGVAKSASWAAGITDIDAETIISLAQRMASSKTLISTSWSLTRQDHGEQTFWAAIALAAMLGQIGQPGQGIAFGLSAMHDVGNSNTPIPAMSLPQGFNPVGDLIPVARIADMLLHPGTEFTYDGQTKQYPNIKLLWWAGGNPFHHHQDLARLERAWQAPDTIIVNDWTWNANAKHADIVLACTTTLEREDLALTPRDSTIAVMSKAIEPVGEARNDFDIFAGIARELEAHDSFTEGKTAEQWIDWIYGETLKAAADSGIELPTLDELRESGWHEVPSPEVPTDNFSSMLENLTTPSGKIEIYSETIAGFGYADCAGHPKWYEPAEWEQGQNPHPLHLISNQPSTKLHSQLDHGSVSRKAKVAGREPITMHPSAAEARGITDGDVVRVFNDRGSCLAGAVIDDGLRPDVVQLSTGAWFDPVEVNGQLWCKHGNPNILTRDKGTSSLAQGPTAHTCLVDLERYDGQGLSLTAFEPPEILRSGGLSE